MSFSSSLTGAALGIQNQVDTYVRKVLFDFSAKLDLRSPVGDPILWTPPIATPGYAGGHMRRNWQHGHTDAPTEELDGIDPDGSSTLAEIRASINASPAGGRHWIVNNVPYAQKLEDGHSTQAPNGMVELAIIDFTGILVRS